MFKKITELKKIIIILSNVLRVSFRQKSMLQQKKCSSLSLKIISNCFNSYDSSHHERFKATGEYSNSSNTKYRQGLSDFNVFKLLGLNGISVEENEGIEKTPESYDDNAGVCNAKHVETLHPSLWFLYQVQQEQAETLVFCRHANLGPDETQRAIEAMGLRFDRKCDQLEHSVPSSTGKFVALLEPLLHLKGNFRDHYVTNPDGLKNVRLSSPRSVFLQKWHTYLLHIASLKESVPLIILRAIMQPVQMHLMSSLGASKTGSPIIDKLRNVKSHLSINTFFFIVERTHLITAVRSALLQHFKVIAWKASGSGSPREVEPEAAFKSSEFRYIDELCAYYIEKIGIGTLISRSEVEEELKDPNFFSTSAIKALKKRSTHLYKLNQGAIRDINSSFVYTPPLPMLCAPQTWFHNVDGDVVKGGYKSNGANIYPLVHSRMNAVPQKPSKACLASLNYLQSTAFAVDEVAFNSVLSNFNEILLKSLKSTFENNDKFLVAFDIKKDFDGPKTLLSYAKVHANNSLLTNQISGTDLLPLYLKVVSVIANLCQCLFLANTLIGKQFFYPHFLDSRGRVYSATSHPLHPQGYCIARFLITLAACPPQSTVQRSELYDSQYSRSSPVVGLDVSCSGAQVLGGLSMSVKALLDTNFIVRNDSVVEKTKKSVYTYTLAAFLTSLDDFSFPVQPSSIKLLVLNQDDVDDLLRKEVRSAIDRDYMKGWVMRYLYSEGHHSRAEHLFKKMSSKRPSFFFSMQTHVKKAICFAVSKLFIATFKGLYPEICALTFSIVSEMSKVNKVTKSSTYKLGHDVRYDQNGTASSHNQINACKVGTVQYSSYCHTKKDLIKTTYQFSKDELCLQTLARSIVPNFVHYLDGVILASCVLKLQALQIPVFVIHDCFYLDKKHSETIKQVYYDVFCAEILEKDCFSNFLTINGSKAAWVKPDPVDLTLYRRSPFILS